MTLLRAEGLETLPRALAIRFRRGRGHDRPADGPDIGVKLAFEGESGRLPIAAFVASEDRFDLAARRAKIRSDRHARSAQIGLVEPPVVARDPRPSGKYFLLDGHLRVEALKDLGMTEVECLVSTDDEAFTYNKRVNRHRGSRSTG